MNKSTIAVNVLSSTPELSASLLYKNRKSWEFFIFSLLNLLLVSCVQYHIHFTCIYKPNQLYNLCTQPLPHLAVNQNLTVYGLFRNRIRVKSTGTSIRSGQESQDSTGPSALIRQNVKLKSTSKRLAPNSIFHLTKSSLTL